jgi:peptidoglycan/xylan/chitin deacetylase (PgdA/CDA1 family)
MVFCYHNVVPDALVGSVGETGLHIGVSEFRAQLEWIQSAYTIVPLSELTARLQKGRGVSGLAVLTFDDGYRGPLTHAVPLLRAASVPFALFPVVSSATDPRTFWWDELGTLPHGTRQQLISAFRGDAELIRRDVTPSAHTPDDLVAASWSELKAVLGPDCEVGVHTVRHRNLAELAPSEIAWELTHARARLAEELDVAAYAVAYPYGGTSPAVFAETKKAGFHVGLGLDFGTVRADADRFNLARVNVPAGLDLSTFACWASGLRLRL